MRDVYLAGVLRTYLGTEDGIYRHVAAATLGAAVLRALHEQYDLTRIDGAAVVLLCSKDYARAMGWTVQARICGVSACTVEPLFRRVRAVDLVLTRCGLSVDDIDAFEINGAFTVVDEFFH